MRPVATIEILCRLRFRQAIHAPEVATVRHAHSQVPQSAAMRINEQIGAGHLGGEFVGVPAGGITRTVPSALTSTLRSYLPLGGSGGAGVGCGAGGDFCINC